jgi:cytochrome c
MARHIALLLIIATITGATGALAQTPTGDATQGAKLFGACAARHSLVPDRNMTGPSLAGIWGRKAGSLKSFDRYSAALKSSEVVWDQKTLDAWLSSPAAFVPGNSMKFAGITDSQQRAELIAFLEGASTGQLRLPAAMTAPPFKDLKKLGADRRVEAIRYCRDTYHVTTADGRTTDFWEVNLRFKTDSSDTGPSPGKPVFMRAGQLGDRALVLFAAPEEIGTFIKRPVLVRGKEQEDEP